MAQWPMVRSRNNSEWAILTTLLHIILNKYKIDLKLYFHKYFNTILMEKRLNRKTDAFQREFKDAIKTKMSELGLLKNPLSADLLQFVYDYPVLEIGKLDLQKRKRVKNTVPFHERCCALRANIEQCTRRKKNGEQFCGTHIKGRPHGQVKEGEQKKDNTLKIEVHARDIKGIIYFIDKNGNVYDPQDIHQNLKNPAIIAKYIKDPETGEYSIPSIF